MKELLGICALIGVIIFTSIGISDNNIMEIETSGEIINEEEIKLKTFSSKEEIIEKVGKSSNDRFFITDDFVFNTAVDFAATSDSAMPSSSKTEGIVEESNYSTTNVQVKGVDEGDIIKTNGDFIYYLANGKLYVFETKTTNTKLVKSISLFDTHSYLPYELYIDEEYITVIAQEYKIKDELLIRNNGSITTMNVYDINTYELVKKIETEGNYISSRKIDSNIYMITNKYLYSYGINEDDILPLYKDSAVCQEYKEIPATEIMYFPDVNFNEECSYMIITAVNLDNLQSKAKIDTYLGAGSEIYCSNKSLYVARIERNKTKIHKFKLLNGEAKYVATGEVDGRLLNQYSMDENNDYFRITTTSEKGNSLYVLNENLEVVGSLTDLAKGEKIYATRFMGEKCYLVTYKTVDPLFVIDLSIPTNPKVLGELKIPGYSTYLHPLGENHLIGFGEDSALKVYMNWEGKQDVVAYNTGMKLAIFDITDLSNPKELHSIKIGGRGSSSPLLSNPRVLYYDKEREIFAFPANVTEETKFYEDGTPMYGKTIFDGALVYNLSVDKGISLRGKIEHDAEDYKKGNSSIERIISIKDNFYTLSPNMLKVTDINTMEEVEEGTCKIK